MNTQQKSAIRNQIIEYMKAYDKGGEPIGAEKIMRLFEGFEGGNCPCCNGAGTIEVKNKTLPTDDMRAAATALRDKGFTIRQIAEQLGYKHPGSISHLLKY